jgi:hypothetical protein
LDDSSGEGKMYGWGSNNSSSMLGGLSFSRQVRQILVAFNMLQSLWDGY